MELFPVELKLRHGHICVLIADAAQSVTGDRLVQKRQVAPAASHHFDLSVPERFTDRLDIAKIGKIVGLFPRDKRHTVRSGGDEAGGVKAVGRAGKQYRVKLEITEFFPDRRKMIHDNSSRYYLF